MKGKLSFKKIITYIIIPLLLFLITTFGGEENVVKYLKEKYHNYQLSRVEVINIQDNSLMGNTINNANNNGLVAETNDYYYYVKGMQIFQSDKNFNNEKLVSGEPINPGRDTINVVENWVFYRQSNRINRLDVMDGSIETIFRGYSYHMQVLGNWIYFINLDDNYKPYKMDVNGQNKEVILDKEVIYMVIYGDKVYYSYQEKGQGFLESMSLDGSGEELIANVKARQMVIDNEYIYYLDFDKDELSRLKLEDGSIESLSDKRIFNYVKDNDYIFYTLKEEQEKGFFESKGLYRVDIDGKNLKVFDNESYLDYGLCLTEEWVFYNVLHGTEPYGLKRVSKDGSQLINMNMD